VTTTVTQTGNVVGGDMAGRDNIRNTSSTVNNRKLHTGGLVLGAVVIVALIVVCLIGRSILSATTGGLTSSSTCQDFLQSSDNADKASVMKKLYLAENKPHRAADPFIIQNTEYYCGNSPNTSLSKLTSYLQDSQ
jgi:hypothetical protein